MFVLMRPTLFRQKNVKLLRYFGVTKNLDFSKVIHTYSIVSDQCSQVDIRETNDLIGFYSKSKALGSRPTVPAMQDIEFAYEVVKLFKSTFSDHNESWPSDACKSGVVLWSCLDTGNLLLGRQCHGYLLKSGAVFNKFVKAALVRLYSLLSDVVGAMEVLLCNRSYNLMLVGLVEKGCLDEANMIIRRMSAEDIVWDKATYIGIFGLLDLDLGRKAHNKFLKSGVEIDESVCTAMINMYAKCGEILLARKVFDRFEHRNVDIWTAMLGAYLEHGSFERSFNFFHKMQHEDVVPNESTFSVLLTVSAELFSIKRGKLLHALAQKTGFNGQKIVQDTLIDMYARTGDIGSAQKVFLGMPTYNGDIVTWNTVIRAYNHHGLGNQALAFFEEMVKIGEDMNYDTFVGALNACGHVGLVEKGFYYLNELMKEKGVEPGVDHYRCIINMLIRAGQLNEAKNFIVSTPSKWDVFCWTSLLSGCHEHSNYTLGIRAAELIPDDVATKVSKWYGVAEVREVMEKKDGIKEEDELSWVEVRDKLLKFSSVYKGSEEFDIAHKMMKLHLAVLQTYCDLRNPDGADALKQDWDRYLSEEIAVAFSTLAPVFRDTHACSTPIHIIKRSGKISGRSHSLMKLASEGSARLITVKDAHFFHNFKDGRCSCADYW